MMLITIAGNTTETSNAVNGMSAPTTKIADPKKTLPEIAVPIPTRTAAIAIFCDTFFSTTINAKKIKAVTNLSIIFGTKPAGNVENRPDRIPVVNASKKTSRVFGNNRIPTNIIVNIKSGFIPPIMPGITRYNAHPTPTNSAINTKFFVFIISSLLSYAFFCLSPNVSCEH